MDFALSYENIGKVQQAQNKMSAAFGSYQAAIDMFQSLSNSDPSNAEWRRALSVAYHYLGSAQWSAGDLTAALSSFRADLSIIAQLVKAAPSNAGYKRDLAVAYNWTGSVQREHGDIDDALVSFQSGLALAEALAKSNPANQQWQSDVAILSREEGHTLFDLGRMQDAAAALSAAIQTGQSSNPADLYFRRGVTSILLADAAGAGNDLAAALKLAPSNAYYVLWVHAARVLAEQKDADELRANAERVDPGPWPGIIIGLYLGSVTPEAALKTATEAQDETARTEQICEANFFVAIYQIGKSARSAAQRLFQSAADQCPHTHFQYPVSKFELGLLNRGAETH
jgi:lipoprotein NlpI